MSSSRHNLVLALKRFIWGKRGEPYVIPDRAHLRYLPGTRPVRMSYANSSNDNNRYDALQFGCWPSICAKETRQSISAPIVASTAF